VPLQTLVSIESDSVAGISSVLVSCGGLTVAGWAQPPFSGVVDLSRCQASSTPADAGPGFVFVVLHVVSVSGAGVSTTVDVPILLDGRLPVLQVSYRPSVSPRAPYAVQVTSDRPLGAPPVVALAGANADRTLVVSDGGLLPTYVAQFDDTPGIGADGWTGGDPVPIELLSETEKPALLTVDAKSAENGNLIHLDLSVLLSRVAWDRPSPGRLALLAAAPVATGVGVQVPLATDDLVPTASSRWLPGLLAAADGTFDSFDPALLPGGLDGGYTALGLDGTGNTLFHNAPGTTGLWFPPAPTSTPPSAPLVPALAQPLTRANDLLCGPDTFDTVGAGCLSAATTQTVTCTSASQAPFTTSGSPAGAFTLGRPTPGATAASALNYLAPAAPGCGNLWAFGPLGGALSFASHADPARTACTLDSVQQLLPVGDGTFIVALAATCSGVPDFPVLRVDQLGALRGSYVTARTALAPTPVQPVAALPDGTLVTARNDPPYTVFEAWTEGATTPTATAHIAGLFATVPGLVPSVPANAVAAQDGSLTALLSGGPNGTAVAHFDPGLVARWLYFYPRTLVPSTDAPVLVGSPSLGGAYLLDTRNQRLISLQTTPGAATCAVSGVSVSASPPSVTSGTASSLTATVDGTTGCPTGVTWSASPAGGTLTTSGNTATFSAPAAGTYTITATSVADPTRSGSVTVTVTGAAGCAAPSGTVVTHTANITLSETWAGNGVTHSVPGSITIGSAAVVTIQPCAYVSMGANATITVNGTAKLVAAGTSPSQSISFIRANSSQPWGILRGASATSLIDLSYTTLQGGGAFGGLYANSVIAAFGNGYFVTPVPVVRVNNVLIDSPQGGGVYFDAGGAFTSDSTGLTVQGAPGYVLSMGSMSLTTVPTGNYSASSNALPMVNVVGTFNMFGDVTIHNYLPVRIQSGGFTVAPSGGNTAPVTLTIEPGARLLFPKASATTPGARVIFGTNGNPPNNLVGVLNAQGTAAAPIIFTSGEAAPDAGDWVGLWLDTATGSRLDHVVIEYAGAPSGIIAGNCKPTGTPDSAALLIGDFSAQYVPPANLLTNSTLRLSAGFGIDAFWWATTFNAPDLTAGNTFQGNTFCAQTYNALVPPATCGTNIGCTAP
jgi:hypothetical protein